MGSLTVPHFVYCLALPKVSSLRGGCLFSSLLIVSQGCYNQVPKPGWLKTKLRCLLVVEAGSLKSRCQQGYIFSDSSRGGSFLVPSSLWGLLAILVFVVFFLTFLFVLEYSLSTIFVIVSGGQQGDSAVHIHASILPNSLPIQAATQH